MNGRPLTDVQISTALRAHLPEAASPGLRERVLDATATTAQLRSFPSFLGALSDADPVSRRRSLLIAAALLLALAVASAAAVGALRLLQEDPVDKLSLEPPTDLPGFVLSTYERLPQLPPLALTWHSSGVPIGTPYGQGLGRGYGVADGRIFVDRSGAVRFDRFASADATEPSSYTILRPDHHLSGVVAVGSEPVWVEPGDEALAAEVDPRVLLRTVLNAGDGPPGCETQRDPSSAGDSAAATAWQYVGLEDVAGRPTHHVTCGGDDIWIDIESRLILRTKGPAVDDAGQPIPVEITEVTEITFGEQSAAVFEPPDGVTRMSLDAYLNYICARDLPNEIIPGISDCPSQEAEATPPPEQSPTQALAPVEGPALIPTDEALAEGMVLRFDIDPDGGPGELVAVDPATGESRILLSDLPSLNRAAWSADHRWVALENETGLWVVRPGEELRRVSELLAQWSWSPTGVRLATLDADRRRLNVVDVAAGTTIDLGEVQGDVTSAPVWSPDGARLVYGARGGTIWVVDVDSGERSVLVELPDDDLDSVDRIAWSPDGEVVAIFNDTEPGEGRLYLVSADGSDVRVLLDDVDLGGTAWSPDGARLAYITHTNAGTQILTQTRDGDAPTVLAQLPDAECAGMHGCGGALVWSPDGSRIAMRDGNAVDADGNLTPIDAMTYATWNGGSYP